MKHVVILSILAGALVACKSAYDPASPENAGDPPSANQRVQSTIDAFVADDPGIQRWFDKSHAFAIYWDVSKGGAGVGGARGEGLVYEQGKLVGKTVMTQATIGLQLGGQSWKEVIFLRDKGVLESFKRGNWKTAAQASAVAAKDGASNKANYRNGVAIFITGEEGLMAEASVGGQQFTFEPLK